MYNFVSRYFLVNDTTFYLMLWSVLLVFLTIVLVWFSYRSSKMSITTPVPDMKDVLLPSIVSRPHATITYVACKRCGGHAIKKGHTIECLQTVCKYKQHI